MSANRCVTARLRATDRPSSAGSNWFSVRWSSELPKNCVSHIDASHSRQPLVKGERLVRYEVNAVMASHETFGFSRQASKCAAYTHTHTHGGSFKKSAFSSTCTSSFQQARQPVAKCMELPKPPAAQSIKKQQQPCCRTLVTSKCAMLLGRSPRKNCKNDLDDQT